MLGTQRRTWRATNEECGRACVCVCARARLTVCVCVSVCLCVCGAIIADSAAVGMRGGAARDPALKVKAPVSTFYNSLRSFDAFSPALPPTVPHLSQRMHAALQNAPLAGALGLRKSAKGRLMTCAGDCVTSTAWNYEITATLRRDDPRSLSLDFSNAP